MKPKLVASLILPALFGARQVLAQPVTQPDDVGPPPPTGVSPATRIELTVEIIAPPDTLDEAAVDGAIATELGVTISSPRTFAPALGRLAIRVEGDHVDISYEPAAGAAIVRQIPLPARADERAETIAFVATNLIRDQASELLARLAQPPPPAAPPSAAPLAPPPAVAPPPHEMAASIGFIPPASLDRIAGEHVIVGVGLSALVGVTDGSRYLSIAGLVDAQRDFASGFQIAGLGAVAGRLDDGLQVGGLAALSHGSATGMQIGGLAAASGGDLTGVQVGGLVAAARGRAYGLQIGGIATAADRATGIQIGGVANAARRSEGLAIAGVANVAERVDGLQIAGVVNVGGEVDGAQIGTINIARKMRGLQLGVVNITDDGDDAYPIGVLNFSKNGDVAIDAWEESSKLSGLALRHGPRHIHNVWSIAWSPDHDHLLVGGGLGTTLHTSLARGTIDLDAMSYFTHLTSEKLGQLNQARATLAVPLGPIDIFAGAAMNVYVSHNTMDESADFHPYMAQEYGTALTTRVVMWPTVFAGVRVHAK